MDDQSEGDNSQRPAPSSALPDNTTLSQGDDGTAVDAQGQKKPSSNELIQNHVREISEMVAFLDYSFERAFTIKEKSYIRAYKDHVLNIQAELQQLREQTFSAGKLQAEKKQKIDKFQSRLNKIKTSALFMGEMSELHTQALKEQKTKQSEMEYELRFCQEMIQKERIAGKKFKQELNSVTKQYEQHFARAKKFIEENALKKRDKCLELLSLLDEEHRIELTKLLEDLTAQGEGISQPSQNGSGLGMSNSSQVDWSGESFKKFNFVKIQNFLQQMRTLGLPDEVFAKQIDNYFRTYQVPRRQQQIKYFTNLVSKEKEFTQKLVESEYHKINTQAPPEQANDLQQLFLYHVSVIKQQIHKRNVQRLIENARTPKVESEIQAETVTLNHFKTQDKKMLIQNFFADFNVIRLLAPMFQQRQGFTQGYNSSSQNVVPATHRVTRNNDIKNGGGKNIYGKFLQQDANHQQPQVRNSQSGTALHQPRMGGQAQNQVPLYMTQNRGLDQQYHSNNQFEEQQRPHTQGSRRTVRTKPAQDHQQFYKGQSRPETSAPVGAEQKLPVVAEHEASAITPNNN